MTILESKKERFFMKKILILFLVIFSLNFSFELKKENLKKK